MAGCIGSVISVDCGPEGYYQGKLAAVDPETKNITLTSVFREGVPIGKCVVLHGAQIQNLKVLKTADEPTITAPAMQSKSKSMSASSSVKREGKAKPEPPKQRNRSGNVSSSGVSRQTSMSNNNGGNGSSPWVFRPLPGSEPRQQSSCEDTSSSVSERNSPPVGVNHHNKSRQRSKASRTRRQKATSCSISSEEQVIVVDSTPTPLYRRYEPQVPRPQSLTVPSWAIKGTRKEKGPCGIPILDVRNGYGRISDQNNELNRPIDLRTLQQDFDFDANLQLFDKDAVEPDDEEFYDKVEKPKMSQNFAHNENIVADPSRITSWTNVTAKQTEYLEKEQEERESDCSRSSARLICMMSVGSEKNSEGMRMPVLDKETKKKYIQECQTYLGDAYNFVLADRIISYVKSVAERFDISLNTVVIVGSKQVHSRSSYSEKTLLERLLCRIDNIGTSVVLLPTSQQSIKTVRTRPDLIIVTSSSISSAARDWLQQSSAHVIAVEDTPPLLDSSKLHVLMIGSLTSSLCASASSPQSQSTLQLGRTSFAQLCGAAAPVKEQNCKYDSAVCDLGVPFQWLDQCQEMLSESFYSHDLVIFP